MRTYLSLGCGYLREKAEKDEEWVHIDKYAGCNPDLILDITKGLPFENDNVDYVKAYCMIGQIVNNDDFFFVMNEIWRVLKADCELWIYVPHKDFPHAYMDPFNQRHFNELSFETFDKEHSNYKTELIYQGWKPWHKVRVETNPPGFISAHLYKYDKT